MKILALELEYLPALKQIADRLQSGSDAQRDEGHRLWILIQKMIELDIPEEVSL